MTLRIPQNFYKETITRAVSLTGATNIYVSALPTPSEGYITISPASTILREIVLYTAKGTDGNGYYITVTLANRGLGGTTAQTHAIGEYVRMNVEAETIKEISDAIDQIVAGGAQDSSTATKGITKLSTAPVSATNPIAVGDNDVRMGYVAKTGMGFDWFGPSVITLDSFARANSSSVGGLWTETDASGVLSIDSNKLKATGSASEIGLIYRPIVFKTIGNTIRNYSLRFTVTNTFTDNYQNMVYMFAGTASTTGYGLKWSSTAISIMDNNSTIATTAFVMASGAEYYVDIKYLNTGACEVRIWLTSGTYPTVATLATSARAIVSTGANILMSLQTTGPGQTSTTLINNLILLTNTTDATVVAPTNYIFPYGQELSRTTYADLFAVIGTSYGVGDNSTTFNAPSYEYNPSSKIIKI